MILFQVRDYLRQRGRASLAELATHFDVPPDAMRGMLRLWVSKGGIRREESNSRCGHCTQCDPSALEIYACNEESRPVSEPIIEPPSPGGEGCKGG